MLNFLSLFEAFRERIQPGPVILGGRREKPIGKKVGRRARAQAKRHEKNKRAALSRRANRKRG